MTDSEYINIFLKLHILFLIPPKKPLLKARRLLSFGKNYRSGGARYDNRRGSGRGGRFDDLRRREPMTFREFIGTLPDDITPEAANVEFKRYLSAWWGDSIKAEFEQKKTDPT